MPTDRSRSSHDLSQAAMHLVPGNKGLLVLARPTIGQRVKGWVTDHLIKGFGREMIQDSAQITVGHGHQIRKAIVPDIGSGQFSQLRLEFQA